MISRSRRTGAGIPRSRPQKKTAKPKPVSAADRKPAVKKVTPLQEVVPGQFLAAVTYITLKASQEASDQKGKCKSCLSGDCPAGGAHEASRERKEGELDPRRAHQGFSCGLAGQAEQGLSVQAVARLVADSQQVPADKGTKRVSHRASSLTREEGSSHCAEIHHVLKALHDRRQESHL